MAPYVLSGIFGWHGLSNGDAMNGIAILGETGRFVKTWRPLITLLSRSIMTEKKYTQSQETKDKRAASIRAACAARGKLVRSPEYVAKQKASHYGKVQTEETKAKMTESQRKRWASTEKRIRLVATNQGGAKKRLAKGTSYAGVHQRLKLQAKPNQCQAEAVGLECCNVVPNEWALRHDGEILVDDFSGLKYSESFADYVALCTRCHRYYDGNLPDWTRRLK